MANISTSILSLPEKLSEMVGKPVETIPQVFLDDVPIGGYTEFAAFASTL